jgi:hypothetical protein
MEPQQDNYKTQDFVLSSNADLPGVLYNAYLGLPTSMNFEYEAATDNAVTNTDNTNPSKAARGSLTQLNNPLGDSWANDYMYLNRINWFLEKMVLNYNTKIVTPVKFVVDSTVNMKTFFFLRGEAFFLRAWYQFDLLQKYGGVSNGTAYGYPIVTKYLTVNDNLDLPRNTYEECVLSITNDCDSAIKLLPLVFSKSTGTISDGLVSYSGHASGIAALALKARALLYAASPAYNIENDVTKWDRAAKAAAEAISKSNGPAPAVGFDNLMPINNYYNKNNINNNNYNNKDQFFRGSPQLNVTTYESQNYPPRASGGGGGYINPTQNLVDAFPMKDGYPRGTSPTPTITYNPLQVELNRDPRLDLFIVRNGENYPTAASLSINTFPGGLDAFGTNEKATRTGYYLQKFLDPTVNINPTSLVRTNFAVILLGKPELYLNFAEAAINATGSPDVAIYGYSARQVLARVRDRALGAGNDKYLSTVTTKDDFLSVLKNERRIELCFENFRFWDLRRWATSAADLTEINKPVYGIYSNDVPVEVRVFKSVYMPLPYNEILKTQNLTNNEGW